MSSFFRFDSRTVARDDYSVFRWANRIKDGFHSRKDVLDSPFIWLDPTGISSEREWRKKNVSETKRLSRCLPRFDRLFHYIARSAHDSNQFTLRYFYNYIIYKIISKIISSVTIGYKVILRDARLRTEVFDSKFRAHRRNFGYLEPGNILYIFS